MEGGRGDENVTFSRRLKNFVSDCKLLCTYNAAFKSVQCSLALTEGIHNEILLSKAFLELKRINMVKGDLKRNFLLMQMNGTIERYGSHFKCL